MSEIVAEGIIRADVFQRYVDIIHALAAECKLHVTEEGLSVSVVTPDNVGMLAPAKLDVAAFESYDAPGQVNIGVDLATLDERLGPAERDDLVEVAVDMETRKLRLRYRTITQTVALIDPDNIREEPDVDRNLDLPNEFTVAGSAVQEAHTVANMVSGHIYIEGDGDGGTVTMRAEGDIDDVSVEFDGGVLEGRDIGESVYSMFSLDHLHDIIGPIPSDSSVTIRFGEEFPMQVQYLAADGHIDVFAMLAPRIENS